MSQTSRQPETAQPHPTSEEARLAAEVSALRAEVAKLNSHRFVRIQNSLWQLVAYQLLNGLVLGLGTVLGASILVSIVAYFLSQIELLPLVGEWASEVLRIIEERQTR